MKSIKATASRMAMLAGLLTVTAPGLTAFAQVTPPPPTDPAATADRIVVVGSLIEGAVEDAASPVEVYSFEDLADQGAPNVNEFTRSLSISSEQLGEPNVDAAAIASGITNVNLRGLGAGRTLTLFNGRRTSEDTSFIPMNAIGRIEVLKDGAGVTYGAGAVAGVINFVTRKGFEGVEVSGEHKFIDGSKGETELGLLAGFRGENSSVLLSASYTKVNRLNMTAREYGQLSFTENPTQYLTFSANPAKFYIDTGVANFTPTNDFNEASCSSVGGVYTGTGSAADCYYYFTPFFNFVDAQENTRLFLSGDVDLSDNMAFHSEIGYSKTDVPEVWAASTIPVNTSHRGIVGSASVCAFTAYFCMYEVPIAGNPFVSDFFSRNLPVGTPAPTTGRLLTGLFWEPFAMGGNPLFPGGSRYESRSSENWHANVGFNGEFSEQGPLSFLNGIKYDYALTGTLTVTELNRRDIIVSRMQNALRGYGGPNCGAVDEVATNYTSAATYDQTVGIQSTATAPGAKGCQWFNPFASAYAVGVTGQNNLAYGGSTFENSVDLVRWLHADKPEETQAADINLDVVYSGALPVLALPGGNIQWAAGAQWRMEETRTRSQAKGDMATLHTQVCPYPDPAVNTTYVEVNQSYGQLGCRGDASPFWGTGFFTPESFDRQQLSFFGELQLPITDTLDVQLAARTEDYGDITGDVYKIAGKWQPLDWLGFRASYSTNFQPPPVNIVGAPEVGTAYISRFTSYFPTQISAVSGITPEEAKVSNIGVMLNFDLPTGGNLVASLDRFSFDITGEIVTSSVATVLQNVVPTGTTLSSLLACSSPHMQFVVLSTPTCTQGTTRVSDITRIDVFQTNGPGAKTSGYDFGAIYTQDLGPGTLTVGGQGTLVTEYEVEGYTLNGLVFDTGGDRLGYANVDRTGDFSSKLRGNVHASYRFGPHSFRAQANYTKGVKDHRYTTQAQIDTLWGVKPNDYWDVDLHYRLELPWFAGTELRASILNVTDEDPMRAQARNAYWTGVGNARGRQFEIGINQKF